MHRRWVAAVQRRVGISSTVLRQMKSIKLCGLVQTMADLIQSERVRELEMAKHYRKLTVWVQTIALMPNNLSPLIALSAFAIQAKVMGSQPLTTAQAFTSFAILTLLTSPACSVLAAIPAITSAWGCAKRLHRFISTEPFEDRRKTGDGHTPEKVSLKSPRNSEKSSLTSDRPVLSASNLILKTADQSEKTPINFEAERGSLTTIIGPVGCGKSTLLRAIMGEIPLESGTITLSTTYVGYCAQNLWLPNTRIREAIIGPLQWDEEWYQEVISVCELVKDFASMLENDLTLMGSRGIVLSGGQKHRVVSRPTIFGSLVLIN